MVKLAIKVIGFSFIILFLAVTILYVANYLSKDPDAIYELRGRYKPSHDKKTYLVVEDDNGGQCGPLTVNNKKWPYRVNVKGETTPGKQLIECGSSVEINIIKGNIYYFDYWGP